MGELTLSQKKKLVAKGQKLNALKVKHQAEELLGADFRKIIAQQFKCSAPLITMAFKGEAPSMLFRIKEFINSK